MNIVKANSQIFQALYIDTDAKENKDKIVLIEETCESLPTAQGILNTMYKEPYYGMVIAGTNIAIMKFRSALIDADIETNLGSKEIVDILTKVVDLAYGKKCEVVYYKGPVQYGDLPKMTVAIDLKSLFNEFKGFTGKDFMENLVGVNKELRDEVKKMDLKEYAKNKEWVDKNKQKIIDLEKALKDNDAKTKDIDNYLKELVLDDSNHPIVEFLGRDFAKLKYYLVNLLEFKMYSPALKNQDNTLEEIEEDKKKWPDNANLIDPREALKSILLTSEIADNKTMHPSNLVNIGFKPDTNQLIVALKNPTIFNLPYWPAGPLAKPQVEFIESAKFLDKE
jgi:hypothetical protein